MVPKCVYCCCWWGSTIVWEHGGSHGDSLEEDGEHFLEEISSGMNLERKVGILQAKKKEGNLEQREEHWAVENKHHTSIHWGYRIILSPKVPTRLGDFRDILNNTYSHVKVKWSESCSVVSHFAVPWMVAHQASLSMEFSKTEYWKGLPYPPPGDLPDPGIKPRSPTLQTDSLTMWATGEDHIFSRVQLGNPLDCSLPGSSVRGIFQTRILEWLGHFLSKISLSICSIEQLCHAAPHHGSFGQ